MLKSLITQIINLPEYLINRLTLYKSNTFYSSYPSITGRVYIKNNNGNIKLGRKVIFNSTITSNFVGLFKPNTIYVAPGANLQIGDFTGFSGVSIYCTISIKIGNHVNCGGNVCIWDTDFHPLDYQDRRIHKKESIYQKPVTIEDDVFIGANSIIMKGVSIGTRSVIGAGSIVTKNIPAGEIWAGNPAKFIKLLHC